MPQADDVLAGRYQLRSPIASGGMSTVWLARDEILARNVAVKILHDHLAKDDEFLERFRREAVAAAGLTHPNIVSIYDTGEVDSADTTCHFIVMEHCGGGTLAQLLKDSGPFPTDRVCDVGVTICAALGYAHSKGIIHRDIKPANVLMGDDGLLKVGDFGIAKAAGTQGDITTTGKIMGTVAYISPEYATDQDLDARSDIYSLGIVLYELAVGKPPFDASTSMATALRHINDAPTPLRNMRAGIPRSLEAVVMRALEKDPDRRYQSAEDMKEALEAIAPGRQGSTISMASTPRARAETQSSTFRTESRWITPVVGLIVGAVILAALAAAVFDDDPIGARGGSPDATAGTKAIKVVDVADFDPHVDGSEDPGGLTAVTDGDPATVWKTDDYRQPLNATKPGVGVLLDIGESREVTRIEIVASPGTDLQLLAGDSLPADESDLEVVADASAIAGEIVLEPATTARYWVVWITDLPGGGGGSATIGEVRFFGP
jgi:hypothetical protein